MKKIMRIALVFALAGATLVGCTKDYSGDISDLNKKASEQQAAITALQSAVSNAQTAADAAAATANSALSLAKAAATAEELDAVKATLAMAATAEELKAVDAKYAAYIPAIEAAAKAADLEEFKTLVAEEIAKLATKDEVAAFKAAYDEMVVALKAADTANDGKIAELKAACDTKFAALDAADKQNAEAIVALKEALEAAIEKGDKKNADAIDALEETTAAAIAATNVRIDSVVTALNTHKTEAVARIVDLENNYIDLEARVLALEDVDKDLKVLIAENKAGIETNAADIAALETKLNGLIDKVYEDVWTINAPAAEVCIPFISTYFNPVVNNPVYKALATAFPEVKDLEKTDLTFGGSVPFAVNPDTFTFDDTFTFKFYDAQGKEYPAALSNPVKGLDSALIVLPGYIESPIKTKAAVGGYWTLSFEPVADTTGRYAEYEYKGLSLVATKGEQLAATEFAYLVYKLDVSDDVAITLNPTRVLTTEHTDAAYPEYWAEFADKIELVDAEEAIVEFNDALFAGKYIIEAATDAKTTLAVEEYGIEFPAAGTDGIVIKNYPEGRSFIQFGVVVKALGYNGSVDKEEFTLRVVKKATPATLAAQTFTYTDTTETFELRWKIADYIKTAAGKKEFFEAQRHTLVFVNKEDSTAINANDLFGFGGVKFNFYNAEDEIVRFENEDSWADAVTFGLTVANNANNPFKPGEYDVYFLVNNPGTDSDAYDRVVGYEPVWDYDWWHGWYVKYYEPVFKAVYNPAKPGNVVYIAETTLTVANDEALAPELYLSVLPQICKDGVVQAVGKYRTDNGGEVYYNFMDDPVIVVDEDAVPENAKIIGYVDLDPKNDWLGKVTDFDHEISFKADSNFVSGHVVRNVAAVVRYFGNNNNVAYFPFKITVLSPVEGGFQFAADPTIYFPNVEKDPTSFMVDSLFKKNEAVVVKYGTDAGKKIKTIAEAGAYYKSVKVTLNKDDEKTADRFLEKNNGKFEWTVGQSIEAKNRYTSADIPAGKVEIRATLTVVDKWGVTTKHDFVITIKAEK